MKILNTKSLNIENTNDALMYSLSTSQNMDSLLLGDGEKCEKGQRNVHFWCIFLLKSWLSLCEKCDEVTDWVSFGRLVALFAKDITF